jgi:hypothetical protein
VAAFYIEVSGACPVKANCEGGMMKDLSGCYVPRGEVLEQRAHEYIERLTAFIPMDDVEAELVADYVLGHIEEYEIDHRRFAGLSEHDLKLTWLSALAFLRSGDRSLFPDLDDAIAELLLRGLEPPYGEVNKIANYCNSSLH